MAINKGLAAFEQHGVKVARTIGTEAIGMCPWCKKPDKFFIETERLVWDCKVCGVHGNFDGFLAEAARRNAQAVGAGVLAALAKDRGGLGVATLAAFGVGFRAGVYTYPAKLLIGGTWKVSDLRRYSIGGRPHSTSGAHLGLVVPGDIKGTARVWVCEGEWDGMALWQILRAAGCTDDVVAVCGAGNFPKKLAGWFSGKEVELLFDHDEPGQAGCARAWATLGGAAKLRRLDWGKVRAGVLKDGYDVRDLCVGLGWKCAAVLERIRGALTDAVPAALGVQTGPAGVAMANAAARAKALEAEIDPKGRGMSVREVEKHYRKWLELPDAEPLDVMFGAVMANRLSSDPLWLFMVAPSGGSKSELLMTLDGAPLVHCTTSLTPHSLISGMNLGGRDPSLIPKVLGKTLVVKDFTTILSLNQQARDEIFGVLRDAYDGRIEKEFGNDVVRKYEGKFGIVGGVTPVIDSATHGNTVLGERFIKYRIRHTGNLTKGSNAIMRALDNLYHESDMRTDMRVAARAVLNRPITREHEPRLPQWFKERCRDLAQLVGALRGCVGRERYTQQILFKPVSEHGTRLAKQFAILGSGIAVYRGLDEVSEGVYATICRVAMDTAPDRQEEIVKQMFLRDGLVKITDLAKWSKFPQETCRYVLEDMALLGLVEKAAPGGAGGGDRNCWKLSRVVRVMLTRLKVYERERRWMDAGKT